MIFEIRTVLYRFSERLSSTVFDVFSLPYNLLIDQQQEPLINCADFRTRDVLRR